MSFKRYTYLANRQPSPVSPIYLKTPAEHNLALCDAAIRAIEQLSERLKVDQSVEQELAFVELTMRRIRRELPQ